MSLQLPHNTVQVLGGLEHTVALYPTQGVIPAFPLRALKVNIIN